MPTAIRKLGTFLFVIGCIAVIAGLVPVAAGRVDGKVQQVLLAAAVVGGLLVVSGLVTDWLGSQAVRDQASADEGLTVGGSRPPSMRLSGPHPGQRLPRRFDGLTAGPLQWPGPRVGRKSGSYKREYDNG